MKFKVLSRFQKSKTMSNNTVRGGDAGRGKVKPSHMATLASTTVEIALGYSENKSSLKVGICHEGYEYAALICSVIVASAVGQNRLPNVPITRQSDATQDNNTYRLWIWVCWTTVVASSGWPHCRISVHWFNEMQKPSSTVGFSASGGGNRLSLAFMPTLARY